MVSSKSCFKTMVRYISLVMYMVAVVRRISRGSGVEVSKLLVTDYADLVTDSVEKLSSLVFGFGIVWKRRKLRVNVGKSKILKFRLREEGPLGLRLGSEEPEKVCYFNYFCVYGLFIPRE